MSKNLNNYPLWTAVITPMNTDGSIDYKSFEAVLRDQEKNQNAVVVLGSTGEALNLDRSECHDILKFTMKLNLAVPVMTGIPGFNLKETLNYVDELEKNYQLDAYLVVTPLYAKPGAIGQYEWFKAILDHSTKPCMLYNVPGRTGVKMNFKAMEMLSAHKNFWAIKEASGSVEDFKKYHQAAPNARMYSGDDGMIFDFAPHGLCGLVSVASNVWPKATHVYTEKSLNKTLTETDANSWKKWADTLFLAANPIPAKKLAFKKGMITTEILRAPLDYRDLEDMSLVVSADQAVENWLKQTI